MSWRSNPPSQYVKVGGGLRVPLWSLVLSSFVCLALGVTAGLTVTNGNDTEPADPHSAALTKKREALVRTAQGELMAVSQIDAVTDVKGAPSSFGGVVLGREIRDVCVFGMHGWKVHDWYDSACGVQVTWYLATARGSTQTVESAVRSRFEAREIPTVDDFHWNERTGPLPGRLSGEVQVQSVESSTDLSLFQRSSSISIPEQQSTYHDSLRSFDLPEEYKEHGGKRRVIVRVSLVAQYAWTKS